MTYRGKKSKRGEIAAHLNFLAEIYGVKRKAERQPVGATVCPFTETDLAASCDCPANEQGGRRCRYGLGEHRPL
jgi:hypothetical protein